MTKALAQEIAESVAGDGPAGILLTSDTSFLVLAQSYLALREAAEKVIENASHECIDSYNGNRWYEIPSDALEALREALK